MRLDYIIIHIRMPTTSTTKRLWSTENILIVVEPSPIQSLAADYPFFF